MPHELARIKFERITRAILLNLDTWIETVAEAEAAAIPGNKARLLHLQRNMMQAKAALERLVQDADP